MTATVVLIPVREFQFWVEDSAYQWLMTKHHKPLWPVVRLAPCTGGVHCFIEKVCCASSTSPKPIDAHIRKHLINVYGLFRQFLRGIGPLFEFFYNPSHLPDG